MENNWLVISYFANTDTMAPSHHIDDRLPYFKERGVNIRLLSSPCGLRYREILHTIVPSLAPSGIRYEVRYFLRRKTKKRFWFKLWETILLLPVYPFYFIEKALFRLDSTWSWFVTASFAAIVIAMKQRPQLIYSTGGPVNAHVAAMIASFITGVPYIAELQDPIVNKYVAPSRTERLYMKMVEKIIFRTAERVIFLTEKAAENARERHSESKAGAITLYAGAVPCKSASIHKKSNIFNIAHFGSLGGSRNLRYLLKAINSLLRESPHLRHSLTLSLYGSNSRNVQSEIRQFPYPDILEVNGKMSRQRAVEIMSEVDVLLLIQNTDDVSVETIPSKTFEYLHSGRPVLALVYRNPELKGMLEALGHTVVDADSEESIKKGLHSLITQWQEDSVQPSPPPSPYTTENAVNSLISLTNSRLIHRV